jgi:methylmalonyl-CoA epimerase
MKPALDHIGIAVKDAAEALAFYRDALGLEVEGVEDVGSQRVRAHFLRAGAVNLELLEATSPDSPIAKYLEKRGPGLHHITLRVDDVRKALAALKARGFRLIDEEPRPGAEGASIAFVHPSAAHGVLVELKEARAGAGHGQAAGPPVRMDAVQRFTLGDLELVSLNDGFFALDGGSMFGTIPKPLWERQAAPDARNRIPLAMRPLLVRGARTMIIDAGLGDKENDKFREIYAVDRRRNLDQSLADAGVSPEDIDIVLATHLHFDHAGGFTVRDASGRLKPRFPRAQYIVRRGEWHDATHTHERNRASYLADNFVPLAEAGVVQFVDEDTTIMPGVRVRRTGGHTREHQMVAIESGGQRAAFVADLLPTKAHLPPAWVMGFDLYPVESLEAKKAFVQDAIAHETLVFLEHDPSIAAARIRLADGKPAIVPEAPR